VSIGPDVADVLDELGAAFTIHYVDGSTATGEKLDYDTFPEHSSEFIRMFFFAVTLIYNTIVVKGNIISLHGMYFLVTNLTPTLFEDAVVDNIAVLYRCNISGGIIQRFSDDPGFDADFKRVSNWADVYSNIYALQTEDRFDTSLDDFDDVMKVPAGTQILYLTGEYVLKVGDRWRVSATEYYKVETISVRRLDNINIVKLSVDTRA